MRRVVCTVVLLTCLPVAARAQQALSPEIVTAIKAATVFVKIKAGDMEGSGSGFVIHAAGDSTYIVTNRHVVQPKVADIVLVPDRRSIRPRSGIQRRGPGVPGFPQSPIPLPGMPGFAQAEEEPGYSARLVIREYKNTQVTAVFRSGMKQEESATGNVVAVDPDDDLAVLRVKGVKQSLKPIEYVNAPQPAETMPIYVFGFPLGEGLATSKRSPAITVGKGSVSSLRNDDEGNLALVQLDAALNHGNSGGPVVDAQGRLIGVAVSRITEDDSQNISFAVPTRAVSRLLQGRLDKTELSATKDANDRMTIHVVVPLIDPLHKIKSAEFHYINSDAVSEKPKPSDPLAALPSCHTLPLKIENGVASGEIPVKKGVTTVSLLHQTVSIGETGKRATSGNSMDSVAIAAPNKPAAAANRPVAGTPGQTRPAPAAGSIGIHFIGTGGPFDSGGVSPMSNWNNVTGFDFKGYPLADNAGARTGATFSLTGAISVWSTGSANQLLNGYVTAHDFKTITLTMIGIPYARYTMYVYVGDSNLGTDAEVTVNGKTYYYSPQGGTPVGYTAITNTNSAAHQLGNFVEVEGLTGASQTITIAGSTQQYCGLCGVEIVNTSPAAGGAKTPPDAPRTAASPRVNPTPRQAPRPAVQAINPDVPRADQPERIFGGKSGPQFRDAAPAKGVLVGFEVGLGKWATNDIVSAIRPIYVNERGEEVLGEQHGAVNGQTIRVKAKPGYAVGALTAKAMAAVDGLSVTFMKIKKDRLDPDDKYESEWVGGKGGALESTVGGDGTPAIGILGYGNDASCSGVGLIFAPLANAGR